jgi:hypothetical protein
LTQLAIEQAIGQITPPSVPGFGPTDPSVASIMNRLYPNLPSCPTN